MKWLLNHAEYGDRPWAVQLAALERGAGHDRYAYHLEQGLGKSALVFNEFMQHLVCRIMVVIAPNSFKADWGLVPGEWGFPDVLTQVWPKANISELAFQKTKVLLAINYEAVRSSGGAALEQLMERRAVFLVIDESSSIKNPRSQTSKAVLALARLAKVVRILNGTPLVQNCMDLFAPLKCLDQLDGMNPFQFRNKFAVMGGYMGKQIKGLKNEAELHRILDACAFRALKQDWRKDLPDKLYSTVHLEMTSKQRRHYKEMMEEFFTQVNGLEVSADMVLHQLDKLRQIASCILMQEGESTLIEDPRQNPKLQATLDIIAAGQTKVIVTHFYRVTGTMLRDAVANDYGFQHVAQIKGGMKSEDITHEKDRFNNNPDCRVLVAQIDATSRGHTLIGGKGNNRCNRMIFFENSFSLMHRLQIEDRIHRGEQDQDCQYFDLVTSPIDEKVIGALKNKKALADSVDEIVKVVGARR